MKDKMILWLSTGKTLWLLLYEGVISILSLFRQDDSMESVYLVPICSLEEIDGQGILDAYSPRLKYVFINS